MKKNRLTLNTKLSLVTGLLVAIAVIISVLVTAYFGQKIGLESIEQKLSASQSAHEVFTEQRTSELELISQLVASDPAFVAYIAEVVFSMESDDADTDFASISDLLLERQQQFGFDFALVTNAEGLQIARSDQRMSVARNLEQRSLLNRAIEELVPVSGYWQEGSSLFQAAVVPLARGQNLFGFLVTGLEVNDQLSGEIGRISDTEVTIVNENEGNITAQASTFDIATRDALLKQLTGTFGADMLTSGSIEAGQKTRLNGRDWALDVSSLGRDKNDGAGVIIAMVSIDEELRPFTTLRNILLGLGLLTLAIAPISSFFLTGKTLAPVRSLSQAAKAAAEGKYEVAIPDHGNDDLNEMSTAISELTGNLQGREALDKHLVEVSKRVPRAGLRSKNKIKQDNAVQSGSVIGSRFEVLEKVGSGGMGIVFQAFDRELDEIVALKVLKSRATPDIEDEDVARFKDEIRLARRVTHPNVVRIYDYGQIGNNTFISMEYVQGYTIEQILNHAKRLRPHAAVRVAMHTCDGLIAAHDAGIVHRDLKPANLIVELDSTVKLMDFGIATSANQSLAGGRKSTVEGTINYLSPEQVQGMSVDERSDVYAMGVVMTEMFAGNLPFKGNSQEEIMLQHVQEKPTKLTDFWSEAPKELEQMILKCLSKDPADRYQNIKALLADLKQIKIT